MNKILLYIVLISITLCGCNIQQKEKVESSNQDIEINVPLNTLIKNINYNLYLNKNFYPVDTNTINQFTQKVEETSGMKINVELLSENFTSDIINGKIKGLALISFEELWRLHDLASNLFEPLNSYLANSARFNNLPKIHQDLATSEKGSDYEGRIIWGIPYSTEPNLFIRVYDENAMQENNIEALPKTLKEFRQTMIELSANNKPAINLDSRYPFKNLEDILVANYILNFDYTNNYDYDYNQEKVNNVYFWGYDSILGGVSDYSNNSQMLDFLIYINDLQSNGIISIDGKEEPATKTVAYNLEDMYQYYTFDFENEFSKEKDFMRTLDYKYQYVYVLIKGTEHPNEVVNAFIDYFYGTEEGNIIGQYPLGYNKVNDYNVLISGEMGIPKLNIVGQWIDSYFPVTYESFSDEEKQQHYRQQNDYYNYVYNGILDGKLYMPNYHESVTYDEGVGLKNYGSKAINCFRDFLQKKYNYQETYELLIKEEPNNH